MSRSRAAATSAAPGSLTVGGPASVTSATSLPLPRRCRMRRSAASFEWAWKLTSSACEPMCASSGLVWRVSSAATAVTRLSVAAARGDRSSRLPSGVATTYRVPDISPRDLPRQASIEPGGLQHVPVLAGGFAQDLGRGARHHDLDALGGLRPARRRQDGDRLVRLADAGAHLLCAPLRFARELLVHLVDDAPV